MPELNLVKEIGITATLCMLLFFSMHRAAVYLGKRFLDPENGLLTMMAQRHLEMMDSVKANIIVQTNEAIKQTKLIEEKTDAMKEFIAALAHREQENNIRIMRTYRAQRLTLRLLKGKLSGKQANLSEETDIQSKT